MQPFVALLVLSCLFACQRQSDGDCRSFIETVNAALTPIEALATKQADLDPAQMTELAKLYEELAARVKSLDLKTPELVERRAEYGKMAERAAATARRVAEASSARDAEELERAKASFRAIVRHERQLVTVVNGFCRK